jgi:capsular polysaccharide biosynthesis protein
VKKSLLWAIAASLLVAAVVTVVSLLQTPTYEASAVLLVDQNEQNSYGRIHPIPEGLRSLTQTMAIAIESPPVAEGTIRRLGLRVSQGELLNNLSAQQVEASQFIRLSYTDTDPARAKEVVNAVGRESSEFLSAAARADGMTATVIDKASVPDAPASPRPLRNGLIALVAALAISPAAVLAAGVAQRGAGAMSTQPHPDAPRPQEGAQRRPWWRRMFGG